MTVSLRRTVRYIGVAADPKPRLESNSTTPLAPGAEFLEADTYINYIWDGSTWYSIKLCVSTS